MEIQDEINKLEKQLKESSSINSKLSLDQIKTLSGRKEIYEQSLESIENELHVLEVNSPEIPRLLSEMMFLEEKISNKQQVLSEFYSRHSPHN